MSSASLSSPVTPVKPHSSNKAGPKKSNRGSAGVDYGTAKRMVWNADNTRSYFCAQCGKGPIKRTLDCPDGCKPAIRPSSRTKRPASMTPSAPATLARVESKPQRTGSTTEEPKAALTNGHHATHSATGSKASTSDKPASSNKVDAEMTDADSTDKQRTVAAAADDEREPEQERPTKKVRTQPPPPAHSSSQSQPSAAASSVSFAPPLAAASFTSLVPSHSAPLPVRTSAAVLTASQATLDAMYELVDAALSPAVPRCTHCQQPFSLVPVVVPASPPGFAVSPPFSSSASAAAADSPAAAAAAAAAVASTSGTYDRTPRVLSCGHSFCTTCCDAAMRLDSRRLVCFTCSHAHSLPFVLGSTPTSSSEVLPANTALMAMMSESARFMEAVHTFNIHTQRMCSAARAAAAVTFEPAASSPSSSAAAADASSNPSIIDETALLQLETTLFDQKQKQYAALVLKRAEQLSRRAEMEERDRAAAARAAEKRAEKRAVERALAKEQAARAAAKKQERLANGLAPRSSRDSSDDSDDGDDGATARQLIRMPTHAEYGHLAVSSTFKALSVPLRTKLARWLGTDFPCWKSKLLFRASRDGWKAEDFFHYCSHKGPTLLLVRVAPQKKYISNSSATPEPAAAAAASSSSASVVSTAPTIFGAFLNVPWFRPDDPPRNPSEVNCRIESSGSKNFTNVIDTTYRSFLFSLHNTSRYPFRMTLCGSRGPALIAHPSLGPMLGGKAKSPDGATNIRWPNLSLMWNERQGHMKESNICNDPQVSNCTYQLEHDEEEADERKDDATEPHDDDSFLRRPPPDFRCDQLTFGGRQLFAMAECEVYSMA